MFSIKKTTTLKTIIASGSAAAILIMATNPATAQVGNATQIADPSRAGNELLDLGDLPKLSENVVVKKSSLQGAPENSENIIFHLESLNIEGVSAYSAQDIDYIYRDKLGAEVSLADIYGIANTLTNKYRNEGYILTQVVIPPQTIEGGVVKLRVVEGYIDQITIEGEPRETAIKQIRKYAENLKEGNILNAKTMERYLLLINDLPGVTARSILSPSKTQPGASDLKIIIDRENYEAQIGFNNHGSRFLGPYQASFSGSANSRFGYNERISGRFVNSGDKNRINELMFGSIVYEQPISSLGTTLRLLGSITATEPGDSLDEFDVHGNSKLLGATVTHPFIRSRTMNLYGRASFDYRNVKSRNNLEPSREDRIRSLRVGTTFQFMDTLFGVGVNAIDLEVSRGLRAFGATSKGDANTTRAQGNPEYTKAEIQLQRLQRISPKMNLLLAGSGQWSATPLLSSEEFGVGGFNTGRGYDSSEIVGDDGISGKIELQWNEPRKIKYLHDYQLFSFFDAGRVWDQDATTSDNKRESLASVGLGIRADITEKTEAGLGVAFPLTHRVDATNDRDPRFYFSVSHKF
ncbi:MAG: ShlB/FhaC/HecB family hemolysin secretion/activation protein [Alphaproteobacteria bacterium]